LILILKKTNYGTENFIPELEYLDSYDFEKYLENFFVIGEE